MTSQGAILRSATIQRILGLATIGVSAVGVISFAHLAHDLDFPGRTRSWRCSRSMWDVTP